jgi:hypothetical protein
VLALPRAPAASVVAGAAAPGAVYPPIIASTAFRSTLGNTGLVM